MHSIYNHTGLFHCINTCQVPQEMFVTWPIGLMFKQLGTRQMLMYEKTNVIPIRCIVKSCKFEVFRTRSFISNYQLFDCSSYSGVGIKLYNPQNDYYQFFFLSNISFGCVK